MTIGAYGTSATATSRSTSSFGSLKGDLSVLQTQLATGKNATTYGGLGAGATTSLDVRARLSSLGSYAANMDDANLRLSLMTGGLQAAQTLSSNVKSALGGSLATNSAGRDAVQLQAADGLKQMIDILNTESGGRYLFAGRASDKAPVANYDLIMNGDATRAGLTQLITERTAADAGTTGLGRLTVAQSGPGVMLSEAPGGLPFGFTIAGTSATGSGIAASASSGPGAAATLAVNAQPAAGDAVQVVLGLPDGSRQTITLTAAQTGTSGQSGTFSIGADATATAANLAAALQGAVQSLATTALPSASALRAADDLFGGTSSSPPARVAGPPYDTATATVPGTAANTVIWYTGDDAAGSARDTAPVRVADGRSVGIGARADEPALRGIMAGLAALAAGSFPSTDATATGRYAALSDGVSDRLGPADRQPSVPNMIADLSVASTAIGAAGDRLTAEKTQAEDLLDGVETADPNAVAMKLLSLQTRLQASYQTTSTIAKMSLVNFI